MSSPSRSYSSDDGRFQVILPSSVENKIIAFCRGARGRETGGVLVGNYTPDRATAILTAATSPPRDSKAGRTWFHRGVVGLQRFLAKLWSKPSREYYIGEWHHHPSIVVAPSGDDVRQMEMISADENYRCPEPVLVIVGISRNKEWNAKVFVFPITGEPAELKEFPG